MLRAQDGGYSYDIRHIELDNIGPAPSEGRSLVMNWMLYYEPIEKPLDVPALYDKQHQPLPALRAHCEAIASELEDALTRLQAAMAGL